MITSPTDTGKCFEQDVALPQKDSRPAATHRGLAGQYWLAGSIMGMATASQSTLSYNNAQKVQYSPHVLDLPSLRRRQPTSQTEHTRSVRLVPGILVILQLLQALCTALQLSVRCNSPRPTRATIGALSSNAAASLVLRLAAAHNSNSSRITATWRIFPAASSHTQPRAPNKLLRSDDTSFSPVQEHQ